MPGNRLTLLPHEVMVLTQDDTDGRRQREQTAPRSAVEVHLRGLKAVGSWSSFLAYAIVAGVLSWVALWQSSVFLLVGAVLVAPYPSPALNAALGTATGDRRLVGRAVLRYAASLALGVAVAYGLTLAAGLPVVTDFMQAVSFVSATSVLLPLGAGVAGGLYLTQSEQSSLLSAVAAGVLVTAALVPPVGLIGMSAALGEWAMAKRGGFLLLLQIVGINAAAPLLLWAYGVRPRPAWVDRGRRAVAGAGYALTVAALAGMMAWQFLSAPALLRPTLAMEAQGAVVEELSGQTGGVRLVSADFRYLASRPGEPDLLLGALYVLSTGEGAGNQAFKDRVEERVGRLIRERGYDAVPVVTVTVLEPAPGAHSARRRSP